MGSSDKQRSAEEALYLEAESRTNRDNVVYFFVLAMILLLCEFLNEVSIFNVSPFVMRVGTGCGLVCFLTPVLILRRPLALTNKNPARIEYRAWHKYVILTATWLGTACACITLTHHAVILMAIPIMIMARYRNGRKLVLITMVMSTVCVLLGVYGGYFWGCFDGNLLQLAKTDENVADLALRKTIATPKRMVDLLTHYALSREFTVLALTLLATKISRRSDAMLHRQVQLQSAIEQEMLRTNAIQGQVISAMANLIENRDSSTGEHVKRTSYYVERIICELRTCPEYLNILTDKAAETIVEAAPLHDIGKIVVSDRILQKPGRLTREEYDEIKLHAVEGTKVIENVLGSVEDEEFLNSAKEIASGHHERWDGNGYPNGLSGEQIPLSARIMAVADVFDALVSERVYKSPMPPEQAFELIEAESGKQFDPAVVGAFCRLRPNILDYLAGMSAEKMNAE